MRVNKKTLLSLVLIICMVFSLCGCNETNNTEGAKTLCESFCEDVRSGDTAKLMGYFAGSDVSEDDLKNIIKPSDINVDQDYYLNAIKSTISYTVQDPVYDKNSKTATVYVSWHQVDYSDEKIKSASTIADFDKALSEGTDKLITTCLTVDLSTDVPRILNPKDVVDAVYAYTSDDNGIMPGYLKDFYISGSFDPSLEEFSNIKELVLSVNFKEEVFKYRFVPGVYFTVSKDDAAIYESPVAGLDNGTVKFVFDKKVTEPTSFNEDEFLNPGNYSITVSDEYANEIAVFKCKVSTVEVKKETVAFKKYTNKQYLSNKTYEYKDSDFKATVLLDKSGWWDYDKTSVGKSAFASNTKTLGFSLAINNETDTELYYDVYYCKDADFKNISKTKPVFSSSCKPTLYEDQSCYDIDYAADKLNTGYYGIVVYSGANKKHIILTASCMIVKEKSTDVLGKKKTGN